MSARTFVSIAVATLYAASALLSAQSARADGPAPIRHLVYGFTYGSQNSTEARDSATISTDSNLSHYNAASGDRGTMVVNVIREQPDKGLVVTISEHARNTRSAPAAMCVVYGNTRVICDPNKTVNPEEYTLLRFLGSNFVDPTQLDAKQHWSEEQSGPNQVVKADYAIVGNDDGVMTIDETRAITNPNVENVTTNVQTKIGYDYARLVPTSINEYVTQRQDAGVQGTSTTIYQTTLKLESDSMAAKTPA